MFEKLKLNLSNKMRSFLRIYPSMGNNFQINELLDFDSNAAVNKIWYRGDSYELEQLYKQIDNKDFSFWGSVPTRGMEIRKIHTGLPKTMVNILSGLISDDLQAVEFAHDADANTWAEIDKENQFHDLVKTAIAKTLYTGDGAFKITIDTSISQYPIIEFYEADRIKVRRNRGRIEQITFKTVYEENGHVYTLKEKYGKGFIKYSLKDAGGRDVPLNTIKQTAYLQNVAWDGGFMLAEYVSFYASDKFDGRGQSIFDAKRDNFDALDEVWSQWIDALRAGRTKTYIPENLLPRNPNTGEIMRPNSFDNRFIKLASATSETDNGKVVSESATIQDSSYLNTYTTALDLCLQGVISPSTLGIDTKKLDNAEAQREKEKATLYTRQTIITALQKALPSLIKKVFYAYQTLTLQSLTDVDASVPFGEYANPSFESQVETVGKAKTQGIMSVDAAVDELYGDTKDDQWKKEEVKRIKAEQGIVEMEEPAVNMDLEEIEV